MRFPTWAPQILIGAIEQYEQKGREADGDPEQCKLLADIWRRLLTRPEMEMVWPWIYQTTAGIELYDRRGFFFRVGTDVERFYKLPKLSQPAYSREMMDISNMAAALALRVKQFSFPGLNSSPFDSTVMRLEQQWKVRGELNNAEEFNLFFKLIAEFPNIHEHLERLRDDAELESELQLARLPVSRKASDFRAYFIREVSEYFGVFPNGHSPSRIATICSVALEDPDIDVALIRALTARIRDK